MPYMMIYLKIINFKPIAKQFKEQGTELTAMGFAFNNILWLRISVEEGNMPIEIYYQLLKEINKEDIAENVDKKNLIINDIDVIEWTMIMKNAVQNIDLKFIEYQLRKDIYNIRITFWTISSLENVCKAEIDKVINSLKFTWQ